MINLIICVLFFYAAHLFLKMSFSLHKVPFINFTVANGDLSGMTDLSERINDDSTKLSAPRLMNSRDKQMLWVTGVGLAIIGLIYMLY